MTYLPFWLPLPLLGFEPWMVLLAQSWSLIYQFGLHTERIGRLPRKGDRVEVGDWVATAESVVRRRIERLRFDPVEKEERNGRR